MTLNDDPSPHPAPPEDIGAPTVVGRVASPLRQESTSGGFFFWVPPGTLVEKTNLIHAQSVVSGQCIQFFGSVEEVYRRSRKNSMDEEIDMYDSDLTFQPPFANEGITYAQAIILRADPPLMTPPLEGSLVVLAGPTEAARAFGFDGMIDDDQHLDWRLPVGLLRNGGSGYAGVACIDLRVLNGDQAGHLNVTGSAGSGTKSSFLLVAVQVLSDKAEQWDDGNPLVPRFSTRSIIFNVKGNDLMYIDMPNRHLTDEWRKVWEEMGLDPTPFTEARFYSPRQSANGDAPRVIRPVPPERQTRTYYWTLEDVIRLGLWEYLFSDSAQQSEAMMALADHVLGLIAEDCPSDAEHPAGLRLRKDANVPKSFEKLQQYLRDGMKDRHHPIRDEGVHAFATVRALVSRLQLVLGPDGAPVIHHGPGKGKPLMAVPALGHKHAEDASDTAGPLVIDIAALPPELRRFVVAAVLDQVKNRQMGSNRTAGQVYFLVLDELGVYAPRGASDPITRLVEHVAAQLRSQGIILLGAQQQASKVSETILGNSATKVLGASSLEELNSPTWRGLLTQGERARAVALGRDEKMVLARRGWMNVVVPFPAWAMKESEIAFDDDSADGGPGIELNLD